MVDIDSSSRRVLISFDAKSVDKRHSEWLESVKVRAGLQELSPQPYWGFDDLFHKAGTKLLNCFYVQAATKRENGKEFFQYETILMLQKFSIDKFVEALKAGHVLVDFDARTGHNHGTKFRLKQDKLPDLYAQVTTIL
jgi:hypothetical protein